MFEIKIVVKSINSNGIGIDEPISTPINAPIPDGNNIKKSWINLISGSINVKSASFLKKDRIRMLEKLITQYTELNIINSKKYNKEFLKSINVGIENRAIVLIIILSAANLFIEINFFILFSGIKKKNGISSSSCPPLLIEKRV